MPKGTVKWFNLAKGYGFIQPQGGGKDVFVHISAVERAGFSTLNEGQVVQYEEVSNRGRMAAENLRVSFVWYLPTDHVNFSPPNYYAPCRSPSSYWQGADGSARFSLGWRASEPCSMDQCHRLRTLAR